MIVHDIQSYELGGKHHWQISLIFEDGNVVPIANSTGFESREQMLKHLFGIFFGTYTETFLALYAEWNPGDQHPVDVAPQPQAAPEPVPVSFGSEGGFSASAQVVEQPTLDFGS